MANGWTPDRKARQAVLIHTWMPWKNTTGPRTIEGKAIASRNADKGGQRPEDRRLANVLNEALRNQSNFLAGSTDNADRSGSSVAAANDGA